MGSQRVRMTAALLTLSLLVASSATSNQSDPRLPALFEDLRKAASPAEVRLFEDAIWRVWLQTGQRSTDRLMHEGIAAMHRQQGELALARFDAVIEQLPDYAEAWNKRATLHFLQGKFSESISDIDRALELEPRHFGALEGLGQIRDLQNEPEEALAAYRRALEVHPHLVFAKERVKRLQETLDERQI